MPSPRVLNLNPIPRTTQTPLEKTLEGFSAQHRANQIEQKESDALSDIYNQHRADGENLGEMIKSIQTRTGISNNTKVNTIDQLLKFQNHNKDIQEKSEKKLKEQRDIENNKKQVESIANERGRPSEEVKAWANDPKGYEAFTRPPKEKAPPGGLGGIPMTQQESETYENVIRENPNANADELNVAFNKSGLPPGRYSGAVETRRRSDETNAKNKVEEKKTTRNEELAFHKESEKYDEELTKAAKGAKNQLEAIENVEKAIERGGDSRKSLANIFKGFGTIGETLSKALTNKDQAIIQASVPDFLEGRKELFGVRLSDADLKLLQDKLPDIGKSPEANRAILRLMKKYSQKAVLRQEIGAKIKKENNGLRPLGYSDKIEERFDEMTKTVKVRNKKTGQTHDIPAYQVGAAIKDEGELVDEGEENE